MLGDVARITVVMVMAANLIGLASSFTQPPCQDHWRSGPGKSEKQQHHEVLSLSRSLLPSSSSWKRPIISLHRMVEDHRQGDEEELTGRVPIGTAIRLAATSPKAKTTTSRSSFLSTIAGLCSTAWCLSLTQSRAAIAATLSSDANNGSAIPSPPSPQTLTMFQLPSGLKYLDLETGSGPTPRYGQLCSIAYKGYIKLPANKNDSNPKPQQFDQASGYLIKHGNGRTIPGLDEGLHTLKVGGTRRIIIPPKLGYITSGLGPLPEYPWDRFKLNYLLDQMVALRGGTVVFEVTLLSAMDDEADQGYYEDASMPPEQFERLRESIRQRAAQAAKAAQGLEQGGEV
ncbi:hypothetical protein ACA910_003194 [Epithemia clementina (nom. ined.)]